ncbi:MULTISPECIES: hypothetical protein [unclassified Sinorhizobium]|uniref:hypothetical protein n=1 Tax=unclassified Sinorhizobium TaxID=2613772 RepID=UPI003523B958
MIELHHLKSDEQTPTDPLDQFIEDLSRDNRELLSQNLAAIAEKLGKLAEVARNLAE